jgi:YVTN family beta-propeller protein
VLNGTCHLVGTITLPAGASPWAAAFDAANNMMYVSDDGLDHVYEISGLSIRHTISSSLLTDPGFLLWDPGDAVMLVENSYAADSVVGIQGTTVVGSVPVGLLPSDMCYDPFYNLVYVVNYGSDNVTVLSAYYPFGPRVANPSVGLDPEECAYDVADQDVYVTNFGDNNLSVLDDAAVVNSVNVGSNPSGIIWDQAHLRIYVSDTGSGNVSEVSGLTVVKTMKPGDHAPIGMVYDESNDFAYLSAYGADKVYVLSS